MNKKYYDKLEELASDRMSQDIANLMRKADSSGTERIQYVRDSKQAERAVSAANLAPSSAGGGNIVLTAEQFQAILGKVQAAPTQAMPQPAQLSGNGQPLTVQYQKNQYSALIDTGPSAPSEPGISAQRKL